MKTTLKILTAWLLSLTVANAQSFFYQFEVDNDVYYAITGGTMVTNTFTQSAYGVNAPGFKAYDLPLDTLFVVGKNGFVVNTNADVSRSFAFDPLLIGLREHATLTSELRVLIYLPPGTNDSIFIIEWENMGLENMPDEDFVNFQVWLHRPSQMIELRYGQSHVSSDSTLAALGGVTADIALLSTDFLSTYQEQWINGDPLSPGIGTDPNSPQTLDAVPPAGTVYRFTRIISSTPHIHANAFNVYPNPFSNYVAIDSKQGNEPLRYSIHNALGQTVAHGETNSKVIDTHNLPSGIYILEINQGDTRERVRLIKQ